LRFAAVPAKVEQKQFDKGFTLRSSILRRIHTGKNYRVRELVSCVWACSEQLYSERIRGSRRTSSKSSCTRCDPQRRTLRYPCNSPETDGDPL